jgi:hypothetical protein
MRTARCAASNARTGPMLGANRALIEGSPQAGVSTPAQTSISDTAGVVLAANPKRKGVMIQNTGTTVLKFTFGDTSPTSTVYHVALKACSSANDGTGGVYMDDACTLTVRGISTPTGGTAVIAEFTLGAPDWVSACDGGAKGLTT